MGRFPEGYFPDGFFPDGYVAAGGGYPTLAVSLSGTTATATISDVDDAAICYLLYRASSESVWTSGGQRTGAGTIAVTGLSANTQYHFVAYYELQGAYSIPSLAIIIETDPAAATTDFDEAIYEDADIFLSTFGVQITYYPRSGGSRSIIGIVDQDLVSGVSGFPGANTPFARIAVKNSVTDGIASNEVDTGGDKIGYSVRVGQTAQQRRISRVLSQDYGMVTLEVN